MHDYFAGRNPGTWGWGGTDTFGTYGSLAWNIAIAQQVAGATPMIATETGYSDQTDAYAVPAVTKQHYILRTLLEHWNAGVVRTYLYELVDEGGLPFSHYGLTDGTGKAKPVYTALKHLVANLSDSGSAFTPTPLAYAISAAASVHHTLLQKRNGAYALILWDEVPEWDPTTSSAVAVSAQKVVLKFPQAPRSLQLTTFGNAGGTTTRAVTASTSVTLQATGSPMILAITR
jgi:hypothetical protein